MKAFIVERVDYYNYPETSATIIAENVDRAELIARNKIPSFKNATLGVTEVNLDEEGILSIETCY